MSGNKFTVEERIQAARICGEGKMSASKMKGRLHYSFDKYILKCYYLPTYFVGYYHFKRSIHNERTDTGVS